MHIDKALMDTKNTINTNVEKVVNTNMCDDMGLVSSTNIQEKCPLQTWWLDDVNVRLHPQLPIENASWRLIKIRSLHWISPISPRVMYVQHLPTPTEPHNNLWGRLASVGKNASYNFENIFLKEVVTGCNFLLIAPMVEAFTKSDVRRENVFKMIVDKVSIQTLRNCAQLGGIQNTGKIPTKTLERVFNDLFDSHRTVESRLASRKKPCV